MTGSSDLPAEPPVNILLVDDRPANLLALEATLADPRYHLVKAPSGEEALHLLREQDFAVVLLDVQLHGLDGFETARRLRGQERSRHTPIVFLTAHDDNHLSAEQAYALGAVDYLVKPLVPLILRAKVAGFVELFQKAEQIRRQAEQLRQLERREFERQRAEENARFRALTEYSSDAVTLVAADGTVRYSSPSSRRVLGYEPDEFVGQSGFAVVHPDDEPRIARRFAELIQTPGTPITEELRVRHKDGSWRWVECVGTNLLAEPAVGAVVVNFRDISERRQATEALRDSEQRFARFMEHLPGLAWIKDLQGRYVYVNDAAAKAFRTARAQLYGRTDEEVFPPWTAAQFQEHDRRALAGPGGFLVIETLEHEGGVLHHALVSKFPIPGPDGTVAFVGGMAIDVTEQRQTQAVLEESELRFRQLAENVNAVFWVSDPHKDQVLYISPAYEAVWGRSCRSLYEQPRSFLDAIHPEDRERVHALSLERQARGETADVEYRVVRPDGSVRWVRDRGFPIKDQSGRVYRIAGLAEDITERKATEESLRASERRFKALASHAPAGIFQTDAAGHYLFVNDRWCAMAGLAPDEARGQGWALALHPEDRERVARAWYTAATAEREFVAEYRFQTPQGKVTWLSGSTVALRDETGKVGGYLGTVTDISALKRAAEALQEADRRKDEFLAMLAHELRNPLAPIRNAVGIMKLLGPVAPNLERARDMIDRQVVHLARLVDDLLDVSRITRGKIQLHREPLEVAAVLARAVEASRPLIEARGQQLTVSLPDDPVMLLGDATRLTQVFANVLNNAAKYTPEGGRIEVAFGADGGEVVVRVRDNGVGIPAELLPRVFDLFTQGDRSLARSEGGLGIGLTLVKSLVEMHGGKVAAFSAGPGQGSEVQVQLPILERRRDPRTAPGSCPLPVAGAGARTARRVLVVDDHVDAADSLALVLQVEGHEVRTVHDGATALEVAREYQPEVVLLDIGLPRMDGYEVARRLRQEAGLKDTLLVAVTGYGQEEDRRRAAAAGFDAHLTKPADPAALHTLIGRARPAR